MVTARTEWIVNAESFAAIKEPWDRLVAEEPTPFLCHDWFHCWWQAFGTSGRPHVFTLWRDDELCAAFPLWSHRGRLYAMANFQTTDIFRPLARSEDDLKTAIDATLAAPFSDLTIPALLADHPATQLLVTSSRSMRRFTILEPYETKLIVDTVGTFEEYRQQLSRKFRAEAGRRRRKMERSHEAIFKTVEAPADLEGDLQEAFEVEASGWKGRLGTAMQSSEQTNSFYRSVSRAFNSMDKLRLSSLRLDGRMIAMDLSLLHRGRLYTLKIGYDEAFSQYAPGTLLWMAMIEKCFETGIVAHELLGQATDWKMKFATNQQETQILRTYQRRPMPTLRYVSRNTVLPVLRPAYRSLKRWRINRYRTKRSPR